jgi:hypothetical protein
MCFPKGLGNLFPALQVADFVVSGVRHLTHDQAPLKGWSARVRELHFYAPVLKASLKLPKDSQDYQISL